MIFRIIFLLCIFCLFITALFAQNQKTIDSLQNELKSNISDKNKVDIYVNLAKQYSESDSLNSVKYINKAIQLAEKADYPEGKIDALYQKGWLVFSLGYYPEAEMIFQQMIDESDIHHYLKGKGNGYNGLGSIYNYQGNYEKAMESYFTSLEIREDLDDKAGMASSYNNIGNVYDSQGNHEKALEYHLRSLEIEKELGDQMGISLSYTNVGYSYFYQNNYEKALEYHLKALRISEVLQDQLGIATNYVNIGDIHVKQGNYEKALEAYPKAIEIAKKIGYKEVLSNSFTGLGGVYVEQKQWVLAREYLKKGLEVGQEIGLLASIRDASKKLSLVEKELNNYRAAYQYHLLFKEMEDSLQNDELTQKVTRLEAEYEFQQEKDSIQNANQVEQALLEKDIEKRKVTQWAAFIGLVLLGTLLVISFLFLRSKTRSNQLLTIKTNDLKLANEEILMQQEEILVQNEQLQELNKLKDRIFSIVAHDLKAPINSLQGLLVLFEGDYGITQEEMLEHFTRVSQNVAGISGLLNNLLYWARLQMQGSLELSPTSLDTSVYVEEVVQLFAEIARFKNIQTLVKVEANTPKVYIDPEIIRFILRNLLNNAYKFSEKGGKIIIQVTAIKNNQVKISVQDEGVGMDESTKNQLFKDFVKSKQGTDAERGTGLGLMLCQEFIEASEGQIGVESELGKGSTFWFTMPQIENL